MILKFRAWDTFDEDMVNDIFFSWQDCGYESLNECLADERWSFMQSTGLLDKNGKEIFEGDVVSFSIDDGWDYVVSKNGLIIYWDGCYQILENGIKYRINQCLEEDIEVIGNIYENPELVEEEP